MQLLNLLMYSSQILDLKTVDGYNIFPHQIVKVHDQSNRPLATGYFRWHQEIRTFQFMTVSTQNRVARGKLNYNNVLFGHLKYYLHSERDTLVAYMHEDGSIMKYHDRSLILHIDKELPGPERKNPYLFRVLATEVMNNIGSIAYPDCIPYMKKLIKNDGRFKDLQ